jgi:DNA-binding NtrC family response regulator
MGLHILIVDDEEKSRSVLAKFLHTIGHQVTECSDGRAALDLVGRQEFHLILTDIRMPRMSGIALLRAIRSLPTHPDIRVILFTGYGDQETAITALRFGAYDYLCKPLKLPELLAAIERVARDIGRNREGTASDDTRSSAIQDAAAGAGKEAYLKAVGSTSIRLGGEALFCEQMVPVIERAGAFHRDRSLPVLIEGETGTGKEVIARLVHFGEGSASLPFIDLNCAALVPQIFESELFGYEAGAFTGSLAKGQRGKLDLAAGGTLFLDEITEMPLELQSKLLRVLQEKEFYRVGGLKKIRTDIRIICATNTNIVEKVEQGTFRRDLFYRLNVGHICLPPLRERREEIVLLAELFLSRYSREKEKQFKALGKEAARMLLAHNWPGNIRELKNAIELAVSLYDDTQLKPEHLDSLLWQQGRQAGGQAVMAPSGRMPLRQNTDKLIIEALEMHRGNKTHAANYLGISLRTLHRHLQHLAERDCASVTMS